MRQKAFTLVDVLVGTALALIVFLGIFGAYQLALQVVGQSKARIIATALANQKIEMARNLPYDDVGTVGGIPPGVIAETEDIARNNIAYTVKTTVVYIDDSFDGLAPIDALASDYKRLKVKVFWQGRFSGEVNLITDIAPKGVESEAGGGTLQITVFDSQGLGISQADIHLVNVEVLPAIDAWYQTDVYGDLVLVGAPESVESYQITASKTNYNIDRTYGAEELANPLKPHVSVYEGQLTEISFSIDKLSFFSTQTLSPWGEDSFNDSFQDISQIAESVDIIVSEGQVSLATSSQGYLPGGYLISSAVSPGDLLNWNKMIFTDIEFLETDLKYQIYYATGTSWLFIPESDLAGNASGFDVSPIDLSGLDIEKYASLKLRANFFSNATISSPLLEDWQMSWITSQATPISYASFNLTGAKIIGTDESGNPVYKYVRTHVSDVQGLLNINDLEWDSYTFFAVPGSALDLAGTDPLPQPIDLLPETTLPIELYLEAENSLLLTIKDQNTLEPIFAASCRLSNSYLGYDQQRPTDQNGQALFIPLTAASYDLEIIAAGYQTYTGSLGVVGDQTLTISLTKSP